MSPTQTARLVLAPGVAHTVSLPLDNNPTVAQYLDRLKMMDGVDLALVAEAELKSPLANGHRVNDTETLAGAGTEVEVDFERRARNG